MPYIQVSEALNMCTVASICKVLTSTTQLSFFYWPTVWAVSYLLCVAADHHEHVLVGNNHILQKLSVLNTLRLYFGIFCDCEIIYNLHQ